MGLLTVDSRIPPQFGNLKYSDHTLSHCVVSRNHVSCLPRFFEAVVYIVGEISTRFAEM